MKSKSEPIDTDDDMVGKETEDMEDWMNTWQQMEGTDDISTLREAFARAQWRQRLRDLLVIVTLVTSLGIAAWAVAVPGLLAEVVLAGFVAMIAAALLWRRYRRMSRERMATPLSPSEYVEASRHNLLLRQRELRFMKWFSAVVLPAIFIANAWIFYELWVTSAMSALSAGGVFVFATILLGYAAWLTYREKPRRLNAERGALEALTSELEET